MIIHMKPKQNRIFNTLSALERGSSDILEKKMSGTEVKRSTLRYLLVRPRRDDRETAKNDTNAACNFVNYSILIPFLSPPPFEKGFNSFHFVKILIMEVKSLLKRIVKSESRPKFSGNNITRITLRNANTSRVSFFSFLCIEYTNIKTVHKVGR